MISVFNIFVYLVVSLLINGIFLWVGIKIIEVTTGSFGEKHLSLADLSKVIIIVTVLNMIPMFGWILSIISLFILLMEFAAATFFEILFILFVSRIAIYLSALTLTTI